MITYRPHPNYKYQLVKDAAFKVPFQMNEPISVAYATLSLDGILTVKAGYSWDGPSGPTIDTKNFLRGSLCHDALYQMMREGLLPRDENSREKADQLLRTHCREDGMSALRAWWVYHGVRIGGGSAVKSKQDNKYKQELTAP